MSIDKSCLLMKVLMLKEVIACDVSPVAMFIFIDTVLSHIVWRVFLEVQARPLKVWTFSCHRTLHH